LLVYILLFHDPPTTELSTLSLHDALPIFGAVRAATQGFTDETIQLAAVDIGSHVDLLVRTAGVAVLVVEVRLDALVGQGIGHAEDRKSTRLNSSHLGISYAVFCLKKKKIK